MNRQWLVALVLAGACTPRTLAVSASQSPVPAASLVPSPSGARPSQLPALSPSMAPDPVRSLSPFDSLAAGFGSGVPVRPKLPVGTRFFSREGSLNLVFQGQKETLTPLEVSAKGIPVIWPTASPVRWQSSDSLVVTVTDQGVVEAVGEGIARIVAKEGEREAAMPVEVRFAGGGGHYFDRTVAAGRFSGPAAWMSPMPVYIASSGPGERIEDYRLRALEALKMWQSVHAAVRFSVVQDPGLAYITVDWNESLAPFGSADNPVPGQAAAMTLSQGGYTGATDQVLNRRVIHCLMKDIGSGKAYSADEMQKIITHELGHALGIGGHSPDSRDIMYASLSADASLRPSARDVETLKWALFATPNFISFQVLGWEAVHVCQFR